MFFGFTAFAAEVDVGKLKKNCASGEAGACGDLSISEYDAGKKDSAREHARAGCDNGNMRGCTMLGVLTKERGDKPAAMALFKKACDAQYMRGCLQLSVTEIETGNKDEAYRLAKKTCDGNEMQGCNYLAVLENTEGKKSEAMKHYKMACEGNVPAACHDLAFLISESESPNAAEIKKLYSSACDAGYINSCTNLGNIELKNENKTEATGLYKKHAMEKKWVHVTVSAFLLENAATKLSPLDFSRRHVMGALREHAMTSAILKKSKESMRKQNSFIRKIVMPKG